MQLQQLLEQLTTDINRIEFSQVIDTIAVHYDYQPVAFRNGDVINEAGTNEGSCKIFAFAQLHQLTVNQTLACFGNYYRLDVLGSPEGNDHQNIRQFSIHGWEGIHFEQPALTAR